MYMKHRKKAIVDIDNTLWHFCDALYEHLQRINPSFPQIDEWIDWDFWKQFCSEEDFYDAIDKIHVNQDNAKHLPYPEAQHFLTTLKEYGFHIVIASHRSETSRISTYNWLAHHKLPFDELHLSFDKTVLFQSNSRIVIDDSPKVLQKAKEKGIRSAGLIFPWNRQFCDNGFILLESLNAILDYILHDS